MSFSHRRKRKSSSKKPFFKPRHFQETCIELGLKNPAFGFLLRPGLGKTAIILFIFLILRRLGLVDELLVLAEKDIMFNVWPDEIKKWRQTSELDYQILHGPKKDLLIHKRCDVRLMNYEGLQWLVSNKHWMRSRRKVMLACDESTKVSNTNTQRFRTLRKLLPRCFRRYILTGSPAAKKAAAGMLRLFGQVYTLDLGKSLGKYITHYRTRYFYPSGYLGYQWELQPGARKKIFAKLRQLMIRFGEEELDLPPITFVDRKVRMPPKAHRLYQQLEKEFLLEHSSGDIVAANAAVKTMKLRQATGGAVLYTEAKKKRAWRLLHTKKYEELQRILEELNGEPALVYYEFRHEVDAAREYFKKNCPEFADFKAINGDTSQKVKHEYIRDWRRGRIRVLFSNVTRGLNLQGRGGSVVYISLPWSLERYQQFYMRIHRQGQTKRVVVYRIIAKDSVDQDMVSSLYESEGDERKFLRAMERRNAAD